MIELAFVKDDRKFFRLIYRFEIKLDEENFRPKIKFE